MNLALANLYPEQLRAIEYGGPNYPDCYLKTGFLDIVIKLGVRPVACQPSAHNLRKKRAKSK